jgi:hypothetical protein
MRRRLIIALLALGAIGGYSAGFAHMHHACRGNWNAHHASSHDCTDPGRNTR